MKLSLPREKTHQVLQKPDLGKDCLGQKTSKTCWETDFISAGSSPCTCALKTLANIASARPASREGLQSNSSAQSELPEGHPMVGGSNFHLEWSVDNYPSSRSDNNRDASTQGWGAVCQGGHTRGLWTQQESNSPHINVLVLKAALFAVRAFTAKQKRLHLHLRMDNKGGDTILSVGRDNPRIVGLCSEQRNYSDSRISAWRIQSQGRLAVQTISRLQQLEIECQHIPDTGPAVGSSQDISICRSPQCSTEELCEVVPRSICTGNRCLSDHLVESERIQLPTILNDLLLSGKDQEGPGNSCCSNTNLAYPSLVPSPPRDVLQATSPVAPSNHTTLFFRDICN